MFGFGNLKLKKAIVHGIAEGNLEARLKDLGKITVKSVTDAEAICYGLAQFGKGDPGTLAKDVRPLAQLFLNVAPDQPAAIHFLYQRGLPQLYRLHDLIAVNSDWDATDCLMLFLRVYATFNSEAATAKIIAAARQPFNPDGYLWLPVLKIFSEGHDCRDQLFIGLTHPLPPGFIAIALLDTANEAAIEDKPFTHPFNYPEGIERLRAWLRDLDPGHFSYAHSASKALPFIHEPARSELLQLAMDHPDPGVSIKSAWAAAKIGQQRGITLLARYARDVKHSVRACWHLTDLGREDAIPLETRQPDFSALAEMANWLGHPNEFGEPPDGIEIHDTRELFWPPTNDRRRVWLIKYRYAANDRRKAEDIGLGMVGSTTFALFMDHKAGPNPLDTYALHCCWELQIHKDARAPKEWNTQEGRKILAKYNP